MQPASSSSSPGSPRAPSPPGSPHPGSPHPGSSHPGSSHPGSSPADAEPLAGFVSVLSPIGSALLGLRVGSVARWASPTGDEMAAEILAILFQPEASGDYTT